jgi:alpha-L-rhamnosidase/Glycosyl hydrolases family 2, sugar binding domain
MSPVRLSAATILIGALSSFAVGAQSSRDPLVSGFISPPQIARPRVWWHWMDGNITPEGIKLDLEWMKRAGLAGFQVFDAAIRTKQVVSSRLIYMTPQWRNAFAYATVLGDQLGLEEAIASSPGWSESGGPWVPPSHGMKKYVWSVTELPGSARFTGKLAHPPITTGAFLDLPPNDVMKLPLGTNPLPQYYADAVVIAYRKPDSDISVASLHPRLTSSDGALDYSLLTDGNLRKPLLLSFPTKVGKTAWIQYEFAKPQTLRAVTLARRDLQPFFQSALGVDEPDKALEASDDGKRFRRIAELSAGQDAFGYVAPQYTVAFPAVTAKYFRVAFKRNPSPPPPDPAAADPASLGVSMPPRPLGYEIAELVLHAGGRVNHWEEKAAFVPVADLYSLPTPPLDTQTAITQSEVIDLTNRMRPDGSIDWTPPRGRWVVLRFGYSLLGVTNHPATAEATGLEVDKLDHRYVQQYLRTYLDSYRETVSPELIGQRGLTFVVNDSWEAGAQNWTDNMIEQFRRHRGYDPIPWMPVLTGQIVVSAAASDKFLWDFRKTIADLVAEEHYGQIEATLHERHLGHYGESHELARAMVADGMEVKKLDEVPMSAMWAQYPGNNKPQYAHDADDRESASVAHIYGQNVAAAESFTSDSTPWAWSPATLKPTADQEFLNGINRLVIHESAHQPLLDKVPGITLGPVGQWFNRNETWAEQARAWIDYLSRASFLLQQGQFSADVLYFYGEDSNLTAIFADKAPPVPVGYGFDYINADGLIHELRAADGLVTTKSGMSYRVLSLDPNSQHMSLPVLKALESLVEGGAVVVGPKPYDDPSLADDAAEFQRVSEMLFGNGTGTRPVGKGTVYAGQELSAVLKTLRISPDFDYAGSGTDRKLFFVHRRLADGDLYFVDNRSGHTTRVRATFRVTGRAPEFWHAEDGTRQSASFRTVDDGTAVPLALEPWEAVFVVFRRSTTQGAYVAPKLTETRVATLEGSWNVAFQNGRGAPAAITLNRLVSWTANGDPGVRYFSGTGTYTKTFNVKATWLKHGSHLWIDLGDVKNLAEVRINGKSLGVVWHAPYRVDITSALRTGANTMSIEVVNAWVNRLIGDQQPGVINPVTFTDFKPYKADSPLLESGLIGPVVIVRTASARSAGQKRFDQDRERVTEMPRH